MFLIDILIKQLVRALDKLKGFAKVRIALQQIMFDETMRAAMSKERFLSNERKNHRLMSIFQFSLV